MKRPSMKERLAASAGDLLADVQGAAPATSAAAPKASRSRREATPRGKRSARSSSRAPATAGPRGGETTITSGGLLRATVYLQPATWRKLRERAVREGTTAADLVRVAVEERYGA